MQVPGVDHAMHLLTASLPTPSYSPAEPPDRRIDDDDPLEE
ncbi:hypothetical protein [Mesorhizobium sangaii]|uniref:Uncharacterized protein n=1 Tax=Mesorhizobium sangaii TaxID=505389 RepID=A0A841PJE3_9HYPH|nr:hypothetical protein [Mesorhizobium sangaii]MBB6414121.1 hypothetical protein [Mesorhizobium sangaii]